uniref:CASP-like protein 2U2 n=1 Tax=Osmunda lancea TaxID=90694 RepID=CSPL1_OSMLA|nr:RecName: Full=CASP-like protein 2U2; Short=OlCASPL2U2 [Osmunda lancea]
MGGFVDDGAAGLAPSHGSSRAGRGLEGAGVFLRFVASLLSIAGLMLLVKDNQTVQQMVATEAVTLETKYSDISAFVFLLYTNGLVAVYCFFLALASVFSLIASARSGKLAGWVTFVLDQGLAYVLLAAAAASTEVLYLAENGDLKTSWAEICSQFGHFCHMARASIVVSFLSMLAMAVLSVMSAQQLFSKYRRPMTAKTAQDI